MSNRKVWFTGISLKNKELRFFHPTEHEMTEERYNQFKWDHLIRIDIPQDREVLFYSEDKKTLEAFWHGYQLAYEIVNIDIFEESCEKLSQKISENGKDFNFIPPREDK